MSRWSFWIVAAERSPTESRAPDARCTSRSCSRQTNARAADRADPRRAGASDAARVRVELGTTVATNALLERRGVPTLFVTNAGFGDLLAIGTQERPELFELAIRKPAPVPSAVLEVRGRVGADGSVVEPLDLAAARRARGAARARTPLGGDRADPRHGIPEMERALAALAREVGFEHVAASHEIANEAGLLARAGDHRGRRLSHAAPARPCRGAARDAARRGAALHAVVGRAHRRGALPRAERAALGPGRRRGRRDRRGGARGFVRAVGFDMGGTSTDVSLLEAGELLRSFETVVGGVRVRAPMLRVHTVARAADRCAASTASASRWAPRARARSRARSVTGAPTHELAITDANLALGRVQPDRFPFPLAREPVDAALDEICASLRAAGRERTREEVAAGFVEVANASMAQAIAQVSVARGVDPRECALVGFGGAGGQHVCAVARSLGMRDVLLHPFAGILSAWGIGISGASWDGQRDARRAPLPARGRALRRGARCARELERDGRAALSAEGIADAAIRVERRLDLRHVGTETALAVAEPTDGDWQAAFAREHEKRFGYTRPGHAIEITAARVRVFEHGVAAPTVAAAPRAGGSRFAAAHGARLVPRSGPAWRRRCTGARTWRPGTRSRDPR
jgi:5-oxoprolinase (ATP-hydrolysing)